MSIKTMEISNDQYLHLGKCHVELYARMELTPYNHLLIHNNSILNPIFNYNINGCKIIFNDRSLLKQGDIIRIMWINPKEDEEFKKNCHIKVGDVISHNVHGRDTIDDYTTMSNPYTILSIDYNNRLAVCKGINKHNKKIETKTIVINNGVILWEELDKKFNTKMDTIENFLQNN